MILAKLRPASINPSLLAHSGPCRPGQDHGQPGATNRHGTQLGGLAKVLDPATLSTLKGPLDKFERAEKAAAAILMKQMGYAFSLANQRRCRYL